MLRVFQLVRGRSFVSLGKETHPGPRDGNTHSRLHNTRYSLWSRPSDYWHSTDRSWAFVTPCLVVPLPLLFADTHDLVSSCRVLGSLESCWRASCFLRSSARSPVSRCSFSGRWPGSSWRYSPTSSEIGENCKSHCLCPACLPLLIFGEAQVSDRL